MKTLLISPDTFGYYKKIQSTLEQKGHVVNWINLVKYTGIVGRIAQRLFPRFLQRTLDNYFLDNINKSTSYDFIIIIKGEGISKKVIEVLKRSYPHSKKIFYAWDSLSNINFDINLYSFFDSVKSFDHADISNNKSIKHLPLFYDKNLILNSPAKSNVGAFFVGTLHSNRFNEINAISEKVEKNLKLNSFLYFYYPNKILFLLAKLIFRNLKGIKTESISFVKLPFDKLMEQMNSCNVVIDICHPGQSGLTMRTIECVGAKKKVITNNRSILEYDFYKSENIYLLGETRCFDAFLKEQYSELSDDVYTKYELSNWVGSLIHD
ncbi:hypothetical protein AADZ86_02780 [Colwelliaceae bacterium BS250]